MYCAPINISNSITSEKEVDTTAMYNLHVLSKFAVTRT